MEVIEKGKEMLEKLQADPALMEAFKSDPVAAVQKIIGDLPENEIQEIVAAIKAKIDLDKAGDVVEGVAEKLKGLFDKK